MIGPDFKRTDNRTSVINRAGFRQVTYDLSGKLLETTWFVTPSAFDEMTKGYNKRAIKKLLRDRKYLVEVADGQATQMRDPWEGEINGFIFSAHQSWRMVMAFFKNLKPIPCSDVASVAEVTGFLRQEGELFGEDLLSDPLDTPAPDSPRASNTPLHLLQVLQPAPPPCRRSQSEVLEPLRRAILELSELCPDSLWASMDAALTAKAKSVDDRLIDTVMDIQVWVSGWKHLFAEVHSRTGKIKSEPQNLVVAIQPPNLHPIKSI